MIIVNLIGELGNQMFEYAYARALSAEFGDEEIVINPYFSKFYNIASESSFRMTPNRLNHLKLNRNVKEISPAKGMLLGGSIFVPYAFEGVFGVKYMTPEKYIRRTERGNFRLSNYGFSYFKHSDTCGKDIVVTGLYQSEKYFSKIREILLEEFQVSSEPSPQNQRMIHELSSCNSVCVHVRMGDYLDPRWSFMNICNEDYYRRGMEYIAGRVEDPVFYIFSNTHEDLEKIKQKYKWEYPVKYVDLQNSGHEDMRLMYHCRHFVMPNSTFSWWGSYLSQNKNKIVCVPDQWLEKPYHGAFDVYRDDMTKIPVSFGEGGM